MIAPKEEEEIYDLPISGFWLSYWPVALANLRNIFQENILDGELL